jgi:glycosyltransferase involved in cell wall biosynthesis
VNATTHIQRVLHIQRRPLATQFSVEGYFQRVRSAWPQLGRPEVFEVPCYSTGIIPRLKNLWSVYQQQAAVYHVTGDIHYVCCVIPKARVVLTILDCEVLHRTKGLKHSLLKLLWYRLPVKFASHITVISEETKRQLLEVVKFPPSRIHVIPVSVSALYQPDPRQFNSQCPRILQVGTKPNKNVPRLVQALRGLRCHLDIVGPVDESLRKQLDESRISWTGWGRLTDEQLVYRYREADIVAFASTHEGFGMPIVEAQFVERVCITSNCSSMPEVAGNGACLVDPFDVDSIRYGILRLCNDEVYRNALVTAGRRNRLRFNPKTIADQFAEVYRRVSDRTRLIETPQNGEG